MYFKTKNCLHTTRIYSFKYVFIVYLKQIRCLNIPLYLITIHKYSINCLIFLQNTTGLLVRIFFFLSHNVLFLSLIYVVFFVIMITVFRHFCLSLIFMFAWILNNFKIHYISFKFYTMQVRDMNFISDFVHNIPWKSGDKIV